MGPGGGRGNLEKSTCR